MTDKIRKTRKKFTPDQRLEYAKLMVEYKYTNQQVMDLSDAGATAASRWKSQYLAEQRGDVTQANCRLRLDVALAVLLFFWCFFGSCFWFRVVVNGFEPVH
jgi:transposase-like protein